VRKKRSQASHRERLRHASMVRRVKHSNPGPGRVAASVRPVDPASVLDISHGANILKQHSMI
jgi:hypothetical protein